MKPSKTPSVSLETLLARANQLLDSGQPEDALRLLAPCHDSPAVLNARGVCLLRLGSVAAALPMFRQVVFPAGAFSIPNDIPSPYQANYVTALLLMGNLSAGIDLLVEIPDHYHPAVRLLDLAVARWRKSLPWWRRLMLPLGFYPETSIPLDFPPGNLGMPNSHDLPRPIGRAA